MPTLCILTGPIRSGKTTRLQHWARSRSDVGGVVSPDGSNGRRFVDLATGEWTEMEHPSQDENAVPVGRFLFRQAAFEWAEGRLLRAARGGSHRFLVLDEIGRLELDSRGLARALKRLLDSGTAAELVLVVRDTLLDDVRTKFGLENAVLFDPAHDPLRTDNGQISPP